MLAAAVGGSVVTALVFPRATAALLAEHLPPGARVLAIDAGAEALVAAGVTPDAIVGDMDSVSAATLAAMRAKGVAVHVHPTRKRDTDAALALAMVPAGEDSLFLGPGGGRADHALANLHLLASRGGFARAVDEDAFTWIVSPARPLALARSVGTTLSILPFDARVEGVTYDGLEYALADATMTAGDPYGVSNVCKGPTQRIACRAGRLVVIEPRG